jgi:hypothetical protein
LVEEGETAPLLHITSPERTGRPRNQIAELDAHNFFIKDIARTGVKNLAVKSSASST